MSKNYGFKNMDFAYAFDSFIWGCEQYKLDVPSFKRFMAAFVSRAIYDKAVSGHYITEAESNDPWNEN